MLNCCLTPVDNPWCISALSASWRRFLSSCPNKKSNSHYTITIQPYQRIRCYRSGQVFSYQTGMNQGGQAKNHPAGSPIKQRKTPLGKHLNGIQYSPLQGPTKRAIPLTIFAIPPPARGPHHAKIMSKLKTAMSFYAGLPNTITVIHVAESPMPRGHGQDGNRPAL